MKSGIYKITNLVNNKCYIGSSYNIKNRFSVHKSILRENKHHSNYLQNAWNKYGQDNFKFETLFTCSVSELIRIEQYCINNYGAEYNISKIAGSCRGVKHSDETKRKLRESHLGFKVKEETKEKIRKTLHKRPNSWQARVVIQLDENLNVIQEFISVAEAVSKTGICYSSIAKCARGEQKTAAGYLWQYK